MPEPSADCPARQEAQSIPSSTVATALPSGIVTPSEVSVEAARSVYRDNRRVNARALSIHQMEVWNPHLGLWYRQIQPFNVPRRQMTQPPSSNPILRDSQERRLDPPLNASTEIVDQIEQMRLCNNYHLKGECRFPKCKHLHGVPDAHSGLLRDLHASEREALRVVARRSYCRNGTACSDTRCYAGHKCANHITKGHRDCSFPDSMHFEETIPVSGAAVGR